MSNKNHLVNPRPPNYGSISSHGHPQGDILEPHLSLPPAFVNHIQQYPYSSDNHHSNDNDDNDGSGNTIIIEHWNIFLLGISGWSLVFLLRRPSFFLLSKLIKVKVSTSGILTLLLVGFTEEIVRLIWLYYAHEDASTGNDIYQDFLIAYWLGLGWATAEAIYFIIQNFIAVRWYKEENGLNGQYLEERLELEEILGRPLTKVSAWW
ncbi:2990_t:CDS:2, partial [Gigaspora rosea]